MAVKWVGRARTPAHAVCCPTCGAGVGEDCDVSVYRGEHPERDVRAEAHGFVWANDAQRELPLRAAP